MDGAGPEGTEDTGECNGERGGYDDNLLLNGKGAVKAYGPTTCISMGMETDYPAMQLYTANGLKDMVGKGGARYGKRSGVCFEMRNCPDSPNHANFPSAVLRKDEEYHHSTTLSFSL
jgi:aldose 1-epimerase